MELKLYGHNLELTDAIRAYATEKIGMLEKFFEGPAVCDVELEHDQHHQKGLVFRAEVNLTVAGTLLRAEERAEDLYAAIDLVKEEVERQLIKHKERKVAKARRAESVNRLKKTIFFWQGKGE